MFVVGSERMNQSALDNVKRHQNESIDHVLQSMSVSVANKASMLYKIAMQ